MKRCGLILLLVGVVFRAYALENPCMNIASAPDFLMLPKQSTQVIWVQYKGGIKAQVYACQKSNNSWNLAIKSPFNAVLGKAGLALAGTKKEGDLKTPAGLYALGPAFGTEPLAVKMDYKYITMDDKFIDDIHHKAYNTWVHGATDAQSYERMHIPLYKMGLVVNYNMNPAKAGAGSAIFFHLWSSQDVGTHGCIATDELHLQSILHWLDKSQQPYIFINCNSTRHPELREGSPANCTY